MSTSLVINIAFFAGAILSYSLLKRIISSALRKKRSRDSVLDCDDKEFQRRVVEYYKSASKEYSDLNNRVEELFKDVCKRANDIIESNKKKMDKELSDGTNANIRQVSDQVKEAIKESKVHTANVAAKVAERIISECKDDERDSEIISSLSRDLSKKLH